MITLYTINTGDYETTESKHNFGEGSLFHYTYLTQVENSRLPKMLPHMFFDSEIAVYCDANMTLVKPDQLLELCNTLEKSDKSAIFFKHPDRITSRQEIVECIKRGLLKPVALSQYNSWRKEGFNDDIQLMENNVIIRKIKDTELIRCEEIWYKEYIKGMVRDQPSLPYAMWKTSYQNFILMEQRVKEEIFKWRHHRT